MKKVYFFGAGFCAEHFADKVMLALKKLGGYELIGFLDNNIDKTGTQFSGYPVYHPDILAKVPCDMILIFLMERTAYEAVFRQLSAFVPEKVIHEYYFPLEIMLQNNYKGSDDKEIKETLEYITCNGISVFNQFIHADYTYNEVKWDEQVNLPYIDFTTVEGSTVPMYYPRDYKFVSRDGGLYVENLLWEQSEKSPHLYVKKNHNVMDGDCIIDAGVCEGNFALKYVNIASYIYLFEMDTVWQEPLKCTFRKYKKKVKLISKALSDMTSERTCKIDDIVADKKVDFIKMDIEGTEVSAICGAEKTFRSNDIKASICSYHRNGDEMRIRRQLEKYEYQTSISDGYMLFINGDDTWKIGDLRRGIVYGRKV